MTLKGPESAFLRILLINFKMILSVMKLTGFEEPRLYSQRLPKLGLCELRFYENKDFEELRPPEVEAKQRKKVDFISRSWDQVLIMCVV